MNKLLSEQQIAHIPKLFFIDACRGNGDVTVVDGAKQNPSSLGFRQRLAMLEGNFLIGYATVDKRKSYMYVGKKGSAWMQTLASELRESRSSVQDAAAMTRRKLVEVYRKEEKPNPQQPETVDRLNGPLFLHESVSLYLAVTVKTK